MKYFTKEPHRNFTEDFLGEAEGSTATQGFSQTVGGKIAIGLRVKYFMAFVPLPLAIVTYHVYGSIIQIKACLAALFHILFHICLSDNVVLCLHIFLLHHHLHLHL